MIVKTLELINEKPLSSQKKRNLQFVQNGLELATLVAGWFMVACTAGGGTGEHGPNSVLPAASSRTRRVTVFFSLPESLVSSFT